MRRAGPCIIPAGGQLSLLLATNPYVSDAGLPRDVLAAQGTLYEEAGPDGALLWPKVLLCIYIPTPTLNRRVCVCGFVCVCVCARARVTIDKAVTRWRPTAAAGGLAGDGWRRLCACAFGR
jgi:hypothetical protein